MTRLPTPLIAIAAGLTCALTTPAFAQSSAAPESGLDRAPDASRCKVGAQATIADCDAALVQADDPKSRSQALFVRAYLRNDQNEYEATLADLDEAKRLDPTNPNILHERGYTLGALGRYVDAVTDLDAEVAIRPDQPDGYRERGYSEFPLGRFDDLWRDRNKVAELTPGDADALLARAAAAQWLGRFDDARKDIDAATDLAKTQGKDDLLKRADTQRKTLELWLDVSSGPQPERNCTAADNAATKDPDHAYRQPHLVGDCTRAFLTGATPKDKAAALIIRSEAWMFLRNSMDDADATDDTVIAVALEPDNPVWHSNLGFRYLGVHHSWAAIQQFDRSIALSPTFYAYGGRAAAKYNRKDYDGAFADAKKSFELQPNELALTVLGDLAMEVHHDPKAAKEFWMGAYHLGDRDDGLMTRLKSLGVADPAKEPDQPPAKR